MDHLPTRLRWWLVDHLFNRLYPEACWADMCTWALGYSEWQDISFDAHGCKPGGIYYVAEAGGCYCGRHATPEALKARSNDA
jgi:hypothetical protein